jgi:hypothetical protein
MTIDTNQIQDRLTRQQAEDLRNALLQCTYWAPQDSRHTVLDQHQKDFPDLSFEFNPDPQIETAGIIDRCIRHGGLQCLENLLKALQEFEKAPSLTMQAVWRVWGQIQGPKVPERLKPTWGSREVLFSRPARQQGRIDEFSKVGGEFHWDRDPVVYDILDIIRMKPGKQDIRIVAIPAPVEADPDRFIHYLEAKLKALPHFTDLEVPVIHARPSLTQNDQPYQLATEILTILASEVENGQEELLEALEKISLEWDQHEKKSKPSPQQLGQTLTTALKVLTQFYRPVILVNILEASEDMKQWLLFRWLLLAQKELEGIVVVLVGSPESDLETKYQRPPHMLCHDRLSGLTSLELYHWAYYGFGLTWITFEFVDHTNKTKVFGSARKFYRHLEVWKGFAEFASAEQLKELLKSQGPPD